MTCEHDWQPVEKMRAVYRCPLCGVIGYKKVARIGFGTPEILPYTCYHQPCDQPVVKLFPVVRARRRYQPSCELHRKDRK
jgi:hypothetical protein